MYVEEEGRVRVTTCFAVDFFSTPKTMVSVLRTPAATIILAHRFQSLSDLAEDDDVLPCDLFLGVAMRKRDCRREREKNGERNNKK